MEDGFQTAHLVAFGHSWGEEQRLGHHQAVAGTVGAANLNQALQAAINPGPGMKVKEGHTIYVTVNSPSSPSFAIPDVIDNSSYREAEAKLTAVGFKLDPPQQVEGEKDWVYGILCRGRRVSTGDRISIDSPLTLQIGNGHYSAEEEIDYIGTETQPVQEGETDEFEEIVE